MNQIRVKHPVTVIADRLKRAGKIPVLQTTHSQMDFQGGRHLQHISSIKGGRCHAQSIKTHVADLPSKVQNLLAEQFEREVITFREKLESEFAEIKRERNELAALYERQSARIGRLKTALKDASAKVSEQAGLIARLKNEIALERDALAKAERRIRDARQGLTRVEHQLDEPFPESSGGS